MTSSLEYGVGAKAKGFDGTNKYLRITDIDDETRHFKEDNLTSPDIDFQNSKNYLLKENDIVLARTGASVGKTYIYKPSDGVIYFAGFLIRARINEHYSAEFIFQKTLTPHFQNFVRITSQRSGQPGINAEEYSKYKFYVPKLEEQNKISRILYSLDILIALYQRKKKAEERFIKVLISAFIENSKGVNDERKKFNLEDISNYTTSSYSANGLNLIDIGYPIYSANSLLGYIDSYDNEKPCISIIKDGAGVGRLNKLPHQSSAIATMGYLHPKEHLVDYNYFYYFLTTINFEKYITGTTIPHIYYKDYKKEKLLLPPLNTQKNIGSTIQNFECKINKLEFKIQKFKLLKSQYLNKLFV